MKIVKKIPRALFAKTASISQITRDTESGSKPMLGAVVTAVTLTHGTRRVSALIIRALQLVLTLCLKPYPLISKTRRHTASTHLQTS